ncbi:Uncharacterised protein [Mycobacteroides abscessus subsp. abscessus]|nr:Uncharacterised protein [Mycobacteroides abscessus subsp. abscessus]
MDGVTQGFHHHHQTWLSAPENRIQHRLGSRRGAVDGGCNGTIRVRGRGGNPLHQRGFRVLGQQGNRASRGHRVQANHMPTHSEYPFTEGLFTVVFSSDFLVCSSCSTDSSSVMVVMSEESGTGGVTRV